MANTVVVEKDGSTLQECSSVGYAPACNTFTLETIKSSNAQSKINDQHSNKKKKLPILYEYIPVHPSSNKEKKDYIREFLQACSNNGIPVHSTPVLLFKEYILKSRRLRSSEEHTQNVCVSVNLANKTKVCTTKSVAKKSLEWKKKKKLQESMLPMNEENIVLENDDLEKITLLKLPVLDSWEDFCDEEEFEKN